MAPRYYLKDANNDTVEVTDRVNQNRPPPLKENAEEGSVSISSVILDDPDMDLDIHGLQPFWVIEDDSEADDNVLFGGFLAAQEVSRGTGPDLQPLGRVWTCEVADGNSLWNRRVMTGADCKRPEETDVARVQWLFTTAETGIWDDESTYVYTGSTHNMDAVDYRGQYRDQVIGDCAQASGKNWWTQYHETGAGREWFVWYGRDSETGYSSDLFLTNDLTLFDLDALTGGTSVIWPISMTTRLGRDPQRVYSGVYLRHEKGAIYRHDSDTAAAFCRRDYVADYPNVKTKTKAIARATRLLAKLDTQDDRITTTVRLPKGKATMIRAGMRVPFNATHLPGYTGWSWMRVLSCSVTPHESGDFYDLALELAPTGQVADPPDTPPYTEWLVLDGEDVNYPKITIEAWGPGALTTVATSADLVASAGGPSYAGGAVIQLAEGHRRFRYWRIRFESVNHDFGEGTGPRMLFSLLDQSGDSATCRLGTVQQPSEAWYKRTVVGVTGDPEFSAASSPGLLFGGGLTYQSTMNLAQSAAAPYGLNNVVVSGDWTAVATWDWDVGNE